MSPVARWTEMERAARRAWKQWGTEFAMWTRCDGCGELHDCRGKRRRRMLCLTCFDLSPEGDERR